MTIVVEARRHLLQARLDASLPGPQHVRAGASRGRGPPGGARRTNRRSSCRRAGRGRRMRSCSSARTSACHVTYKLSIIFGFMSRSCLLSMTHCHPLRTYHFREQYALCLTCQRACNVIRLGQRLGEREQLLDASPARLDLRAAEEQLSTIPACLVGTCRESCRQKHASPHMSTGGYIARVLTMRGAIREFVKCKQTQT